MTGVVESARIRVGWDGPTQDDPGTRVIGTVVGWVTNEWRTDQPDAVVSLAAPLTAEGAGEQGTGTGTFLTLTTRYVGQKWDDDEGTVHVNLHSVDPRQDSTSGLWLASHGVYRITG